MKVLGINGSARADGNTALLFQTIFEELNRQGIETELIQLADKPIRFCKACFSCKSRESCVLTDDCFNDCFQKMIEADGIVLGSPVYSADISAKMKALLERAGVIAANHPGLFKHKAGACVAAVRRGGGLEAVDTMNHFFLNKEVFLVGSTYWNMVYGKDIGEVLNDGEGMRNMRNIGQNMAWLLKQLH